MWRAGLPGVASLVFSILASGCALGTRHEDRMFAELQSANVRAAESAAKVAALEARLVEIEQRTAAAAARSAATASDTHVTERLDELIALNHELLARQALADAREETPSGASAPAAAVACDDGLSPEEQIRRLVVSLHGNSSGFRGGLSPQQAQALRLLLQRERVLDGANPWQSWQ